MLTAIVVGVFVIAMIAAANNGEWGSVAVGVVIVLLLIGLCSSGKKVDRAHNNFIDYWSRKK